MSRFAFTYEDPEYEISEEQLEDQEQEVEDEEIYSPYYGS